MGAVVLAMVGDERWVQARVRTDRRALVRLGVDRADERVVAADLAQILHAPESAVSLARGATHMSAACLLDGRGLVAHLLAGHGPMVAVWADGPSALAGPFQRGCHQSPDAADRPRAALVRNRGAHWQTKRPPLPDPGQRLPPRCPAHI